jgi:cobalt/nickel transport system permease protein
MRVLTSISFVVLLALSTRHAQILKVLRIFKIPQIFVLTISMCYRYVYLFVGILENTHMAIKSRVGGRLHYKKGQRIVAWNIATLWQRSYKLNNDVYSAMISRGFRGEPVILDDFKIRFPDLIWLFFCLVIFVVLWMI